jgi:putative GTP pyrophosphokinase
MGNYQQHYTKGRILDSSPGPGDAGQGLNRSRIYSRVSLPEVWREQPEIIYHFLARRPDYQQLCQEVAYVLKHRLLGEGIELSSLSYRAKELDSFLEKLERKKYANPFTEITDFAGVRVVCLYPSDIDRIEEIIRQEFSLVEKIDRYQNTDSEHVGYMAVHILAKLGDDYSGPRYDHIKNQICEIQIRTVLQHAWALIDQHLVYKRPWQIPEDLRLQIIQLSRVLEDADRKFELIRNRRTEYIKALEEMKCENDFLSQEINHDTFNIFCKMTFPEVVHEKDKRLFDRVLKWIDHERYSKLYDLYEIIRKAQPRLKYVVNTLDDILDRQGRTTSVWTDLDFMHISLAISDKSYRNVAGILPELFDILSDIVPEDEDEDKESEYN